ncbi:unnamed protein product [Candida verbasci]|uniref:Glu-AdT subunit F n=1 Tax=Candida verbasci TaxID=1227364 RepID=A0A9W4U092_9ASCO|nr:unnamed protein product [Candida verbasci]
MFKRSLHKSTRLLRQIKTKEDIDKLLNNPTWSVKELSSSKQNSNSEITHKTVAKMIKLSGFNDEVTPELTKSLNLQMNFIEKLYDGEEEEVHKHSNNDSIFRLIASDHIPDKPLTLKQLQEEIKNLKPSKEKGEIRDDKNTP